MDLANRRLVVILLVLYNVVSLCQAQYHGKLVGTFTDKSSHDIAGTVYAEDDTTLRIIGFRYDGAGPGKNMNACTRGVICVTQEKVIFCVMEDCVICPPQECVSDNTMSNNDKDLFITELFMTHMISSKSLTVKLEAYDNVDISVTLPAGKTVSSLAWISVWCRRFAVWKTLSPRFLFNGKYRSSWRGTKRSNLTIQVFCSFIYYVIFSFLLFLFIIFLLHSVAYFWVGPGGTPNNNGDYAIPDETGSTGVISAYTGETITLTFPEGTDIFDIGHFGLWCVQANQDFGHVDIPSQGELNIPPAPLTAGRPMRMMFPNCETLVEDELQVSWMINGTDIVIRLSSTNDVGDYAAFGLSGSPTGTLMVGGDVVVTFMDTMDAPQAVDYYLQGQAQCTPQNGDGACPDTISSTQNGTNNAELLEDESYVENGVTNIVYRRPLNASDATYDKAFTTDGPIYVIWARGPINGDGRVAFHNLGLSPRKSDM
eukprot:XP_011662212.1 PREDICTED: protein Skeletor, isoforms B/C [Strongylocentrotus purpuratus]